MLANYLFPPTAANFNFISSSENEILLLILKTYHFQQKG